MARVVSTELPKSSLLWTYHKAGDFIDCYACASDLTPKAATERALSFPAWVKALMRLRNKLVRPFGLKTETEDGDINSVVFPITDETEAERIYGIDDRHLDFRLAVLRHDGQIYMSTWVHPHSIWGRIYLAVVMPFHIVIVRNCLARVAQSS
ncbi:MAG: DUF2867 domain-containing protein [Pseudomonadota bacterium]